jgi:GT2 family glycosyltransferase
MLNPDGTRNWDWVTKGGKRGHTLIEYWETDPFLYVTGGRIVIKRTVFDKVQWDDNRGFNQEEDIDFSRKAQQAGISIKMNKRMTVTHDDPRYTSEGHKMFMVR